MPSRLNKLVCAVLVALLVALPGAISAQNQRPDIIFVLLDDMNAEMLAQMSRLQSEMADRGTTFENFFISTPVCCPSRSSLLLGNYAHNHGVWEVMNSAHGGWHAFRAFGHEYDVVARALQQDHGYKTAFMGKFFNWFPNDQDPQSPFEVDGDDFNPDAEPEQGLPGLKPNDVPPFWTTWRGLLAGHYPSMFDYYGSHFNECDNCIPGPNATPVRTPDTVYNTDYIRDAAVDLIANDLSAGQPLFLWIAPVAPHQASADNPSYANIPRGPGRYEPEYDDLSLPPKPSLLESDLGDKPTWIQNLSPLPITTIDKRYEYFKNALRSLKAVEDLLFGEENSSQPGVLDALEAKGRLDNTYIFVASDNGYHFGEHQLPSGKRTFFEEDVRIPLLVRGPGVPEGRVLHHLTGNIDLSRTFLELAGGNGPISMDGRSLVPLLRPAAVPEEDWRQVYLLEREHGTGSPRPPGQTYAIRTRNFKYISYEGDAEEQLYDLSNDPLELVSLHGEAGQASRITAFKSSLANLRTCSGLACRGLDARKPEGQERRFVAALFNPCITTGGTCSTTIVWDTRFFAKDYFWIRTQFGSTFRCMEAGQAGWGETGPWPWGGTIRLDVYDTDVPCTSGSPPETDRVQSVYIPRADEPTPRPTGQLVALPNPCFPDENGRCQVTMFVKTANLDPAVYDRIEIRNQYGGLWLVAPPNGFHTSLTDNWMTGVMGNEFSLLIGKAGTNICPPVTLRIQPRIWDHVSISRTSTARLSGHGAARGLMRAAARRLVAGGAPSLRISMRDRGRSSTRWRVTGPSSKS